MLKTAVALTHAQSVVAVPFFFWRATATMTKPSVTAEEKERLKREEMERMRNNFLSIRPDNDKALENDLRRQAPVPLSRKILF